MIIEIQFSFINIFAQFSVFGSLLTFGGMIGAIFSATIADSFGRKMVRYFIILNSPPHR